MKRGFLLSMMLGVAWPAVIVGAASPLRSATVATGGPRTVRILVVGDGFLEKYEEYFRKDLAPVARTAFEKLPGASLAKIDSRTVFVPSPHTESSQLGLFYDPRSSPCPFIYDRTVLKKIAALAPRGFMPDFYLVVLGGKIAKGIACADGTFMFARESDLASDRIAHEMGHVIGGLLDERGLEKGPPPSCIRWRNCSTEAMTPPWDEAGCRLFRDGIFHREKSCRMNDASMAFCSVCAPYIEAALQSAEPFGVPIPPGGGCDSRPVPRSRPWRKAVQPGQALRVVAVVDDAGDVEIVDARPAAPDELGPEVITGELFAVAMDCRRREPDGSCDGTEEILGIAPIAIEQQSFAVRAYFNHPAHPEAIGQAHARLVRMTVFNFAPSRNLRLGLRFLPDARRFFHVDDETEANLRRVGFVGRTYDLQEALMQFLF